MKGPCWARRSGREESYHRKPTGVTVRENRENAEDEHEQNLVAFGGSVPEHARQFSVEEGGRDYVRR